MVQARDRTTHERQMPYLAPYEVFAELYKVRDRFFEVMLGSSPHGIVRRYWDIMATTGWSHPVIQEPALWAQRDKIFPIYIHSDGGEFFENSSYRVYHWTSAFSHDLNPRDAKLFTMTIDEDSYVKDAVKLKCAN